MAHQTNWQKLFKPQFADRDQMIPSLFGIPAVKATSLASGIALFAALLVIPAVFMAASKDTNLKTAGIWLGYLVWAVFVVETLVFIRLEKGWGSKWLKKHWLQLVVIFVASPFTAIVLEHAVMPLVIVLFSVQNFVSLTLLAKLLSGLKVVKLLHLEEVRQKVKKSAEQVRFVYRTAVVSIWLCGVGIVGAAASDGAPTPAHGLALWWELAVEVASNGPELFVVSLPIVAFIGGFALLQYRWSSSTRR
jgi:hypothetical protein